MNGKKNKILTGDDSEHTIRGKIKNLVRKINK
jgi:hypothetical protein